MIDRQKLETVLTRRFPMASRIEIAAAANAIVALEEEGRVEAAGDSHRLCGDRQPNRHHRAATVGREDRDLAAVRIDDAPGDW